MEFALKNLAIAIICVIVALVIISILISMAMGGESAAEAFLDFFRWEIPVPSPS